jgi:hypothetical protein
MLLHGTNEGSEFLDDLLRIDELLLSLKEYSPTVMGKDDSLTQVLADLRTRGYEADLNFEEAPYGLYSGDLDMRLDPDDFHVDEIHRFGAGPRSDDGVIVYAISSSFGVKGIVIDG